MLSKPNRQDWQNYIAERDELFLRSTSVSVSEMATTLAHELNQPLGAVSNILNALQMRLNSDESGRGKYDEEIELALQQTQYAARVISRVRDFTEARQPDFVPFNVVDLLNHSVKLLDWVFSADGIRVVLTAANPTDELETDSTTSKGDTCSSEVRGNEHRTTQNDPSLFIINGDYTMIQQVFTNLLRNAADALRELESGTRTIRVTLGRVNGSIRVDIKDNGVGLRGRKPESLFTPFQTTKKGGMGVGLNICKSFIELHQGQLWIDENEQGGCTAHVLLRTEVTGESYE